MGGGDLNTKKSWHPNTMKNQERVWKAEQAAAEEKKRILELQREREEERDSAQLKEMVQRNFGSHGSASCDNRLHWMYDKPDKQAQQEDYLLGKAIGKSDEGDQAPHSAIPALSRRVVGSSMTTTGDDSQVDLARKLREDPLLLVKERERAARAALLNNPLQRKKLTELLRKEQEQKEHKESSNKKKKKKKGKDLDDVLAAKLNALADKKGINLNSLLKSGDSSDSTSSDEKSKKKKKKRKHVKKSKSKQQSSESDTESSADDNRKSKDKKEKNSFKSDKRYQESKARKRQSDDAGDSEGEPKKKISKHNLRKYGSESEKCEYKKRQGVTEKHGKSHRHSIDNGNKKDKFVEQEEQTDERDKIYKQKRVSPRREDQRRVSRKSPRREQRRVSSDSPKRDKKKKASPPMRRYDEDGRKRKQGLSEEEKAARLAAMAAAGMEREVERGRRVARQREEADGSSAREPRRHAPALPDSLEARIRSNRHYIQRDRLHMNEHFARR